MWEALIAAYKGQKFMHVVNGLSMVSDLLNHLEANFQQDNNAKNAMIDTIIQVLQAHKEHS